MNKSSISKYKLCALVSFAMILLSLLPQIHLWIVRSTQWNGAYVSATGDEVIYSAYLNALIDGRARKNDPFGGIDSRPEFPLPESTLSIQFIPPYVISFLARALGVSASTAMIVLVGVTGLFASMSVFWLLNVVTDNSRLAAAGTVFVLCLGGLVGVSGLVWVLLGHELAMPILPFLRRYQPGTTFPLFFVFNVLVWFSLTNSVNRRALIAAALAGLTLSILIFSYLYLWTAAAAWLVCIGILWLSFRPGDRGRIAVILVVIASMASAALLPYLYLLSRRGSYMDNTQALIVTRRVDPFWLPEIVGIVVLLSLLLAALRGTILKSDRRALYAASLALLPLVLFNQQLVTGYSLQPHHFAHFVANYCVLAGVVVTVSLLVQRISTRALFWIGALCFSWGLIEVALTARFASVPLAITRDQMIPSFVRLKELSYADGTVAGLRTRGRTPTVVFSPDIGVTGFLPTWTSQATLLDMRGLDFGSASPEKRKERFFMHLYYSNLLAGSLRTVLTDQRADSQMNYYSRSVLFGYDRVLPGLSYKHEPIMSDEIEREVKNYQAYINTFSREEALKRPITYAVIPAEGNFDFTNLDRWYERDGGERVGDYVLYRLKLRP